MGVDTSRIVSWVVKKPLLAFVLIIGGVVIITIAGFIIYFVSKGVTSKKEKKKKYDDLFDANDETDFEEDSNIINKNRGKTKTNL